MRVIDYPCYERARELYARYKNLTRVWEQLKQEGYKKTYGTVRTYYLQNKEDWESLHAQYDENSQKGAVNTFRDRAISELLDLKGSLQSKITTHLADPEKEKIDSQSIFALKSLISEIDFLIQKSKPREDLTANIVEIVMNVLLGHSVLGPQIIEFKDEILKSIEKRLQKSR